MPKFTLENPFANLVAGLETMTKMQQAQQQTAAQKDQQRLSQLVNMQRLAGLQRENTPIGEKQAQQWLNMGIPVTADMLPAQVKQLSGLVLRKTQFDERLAERKEAREDRKQAADERARLAGERLKLSERRATDTQTARDRAASFRESKAEKVDAIDPQVKRLEKEANLINKDLVALNRLLKNKNFKGRIFGRDRLNSKQDILDKIDERQQRLSEIADRVRQVNAKTAQPDDSTFDADAALLGL